MRPAGGSMTGPGVGVIVATSFAAAVEAPRNLRRSRSVGACLGLTPARRQSGEIDRTGGVSHGGDRMVRSHLFEGAASLLVRVRQDSALKRWGRDLAERASFPHAAVAVARKLAVVLHGRGGAAGRPSRPGLGRSPPQRRENPMRKA